MAYSAKILKDSISTSGIRITTMEVTIPRIVLAEFNTHRVFSRNSASSRAIPVWKNIKMVKEDPFVPQTFAQNQSGMQGDNPLKGWRTHAAKLVWYMAMWAAILFATLLDKLELHKALANRILEPFKWHTIIVTATDWDNYWALRTSLDAQAEIRIPSQMMKDLYDSNKPEIIWNGDWHLPLVSAKELTSFEGLNGDIDWDYWKKVCVGRCARVSYLTHDGIRDPLKDIELHDRLLSSGHLSPFEHAARPALNSSVDYFANFKGWVQYRRNIPNEDDFSKNL